MSANDITGRPWSQLPQETSKAYRAFTVYLELGVDRSIVKAAEKSGASKGNKGGHWERWSSQNHWVERARAYDSDLLAEQINGRKLQQETTRQIAVDEAPAMLEEMRDISQGRMLPGHQKPKTNRDGKPIMVRAPCLPGEDPPVDDNGDPLMVPVVEELVAPQIRLKALTDLLAIGGIMAPVRQEITGADGTPLGLEAAVASFDPEVLAAIIAALELDL